MIALAEKQENFIIANLIINAIGSIANDITGEDKKDEVLKALNEYINMDVNRFSHKNIYIYEYENEIAGLILGYASSRVDELDKPIIDNLASKNIFVDSFEKKSFDDEFYINTVSVLEKYQGRGFAKELFAFIEKKAKDLGFKKVSLIVALKNEKALKLYEKIGFKKNIIIEVSKHKYHHMIKML